MSSLCSKLIFYIVSSECTLAFDLDLTEAFYYFKSHCEVEFLLLEKATGTVHFGIGYSKSIAPPYGLPINLHLYGY